MKKLEVSEIEGKISFHLVFYNIKLPMKLTKLSRLARKIGVKQEEMINFAIKKTEFRKDEKEKIIFPLREFLAQHAD